MVTYRAGQGGLRDG